MNHRTANRAPELLPAIRRLWNSVLLIHFVVRIQGGIQNVVIAIAMKLVGAAFRAGVHPPPPRLSKLGVKAGAGDLEFLDDIFAELEGNTGAPDLLLEEGVVVVRAVHGVVVVVSGEPVETNHAKVAIGGGSRRELHEIGEIAAVQGERADRLLVDDGAQTRLSGIYERDLGNHGDGHILSANY